MASINITIFEQRYLSLYLLFMYVCVHMYIVIYACIRKYMLHTMYYIYIFKWRRHKNTHLLFYRKYKVLALLSCDGNAICIKDYLSSLMMGKAGSLMLPARGPSAQLSHYHGPKAPISTRRYYSLLARLPTGMLWNVNSLPCYGVRSLCTHCLADQSHTHARTH